ncbi:uncharacterized protein LOC131669915 isoform X2 [Phymastichus coffea]|nr:uncharacterized protein LOC131669915 isoform X2 [Phymastichus coffea]
MCDNGDNNKTCTIIQEDILSGKTIYTCNITLEPEQTNARPGKFFSRSFGDDKAIFVWEEKGAETFVKFITTKLTSCKSNEVKIHDNSKMQLIEPIAYQLYTSLKISVYEEYYDVFFKDTKRCGNRECKISIDANGNFIDGLTTFVTTTRYQMIIVLQPIAKRATDMGYICVKFNWNRTYFSFIQPDGKERSLGRTHYDNQIIGVTVEHEIVGICMLAEREFKINCLQYDHDGNIKLETTITQISPQTHIISAHILRQGGFLLLFYQTEKCQRTSDCMVISHYWITKIDINGEIVSQLKFKGFTSTSIVQHIGFVYENPKDEGYCTTIVYSDYDPVSGKKRANNRHVITNCFSEADFIE